MTENTNGSVLTKKDIEDCIKNKPPLIEHMVDPEHPSRKIHIR